jgi:hypothetical protein
LIERLKRQNGLMYYFLMAIWPLGPLFALSATVLAAVTLLLVIVSADAVIYGLPDGTHIFLPETIRRAGIAPRFTQEKQRPPVMRSASAFG